MAVRRETFLKLGRDSAQYYEELNARGFGGQLELTQLFMFAMTYGYRMGRRSTGFPRASTGPRTGLKPEHFAIMTAIHLSVEGLDADILNHEVRDQIAEEYAEGGIQLLHERMQDPLLPEFSIWLTGEVQTAQPSN
jgi:hypothetical protein